mmetsp:Transcript_59726/g.146533  ORF Transcript_59726/g.146533 Transcript_59726/m.146533 type:complete len:1015 (-) Transcript_59726:3892-6936(-)
MSGHVDANGGGDEQSQDTIQILCCTANIGNQEPDIRSIYEWIPIDGLTSKVLDHQKYPLNGIEGSSTTDNTQNSLQQQGSKTTIEEGDDDSDNKKDGDSDGENDGQDDVPLTPEQAKALDGRRFDVIAIGMQEATFEVSSTVSAAATASAAVTAIIQATSTPANLNEHKDSRRNDDDDDDAINPEKPSSQASIKKSQKGPVRKKLGEVQTVFTDADYTTKASKGKNGKTASFSGRSGGGSSDDGLDGDSNHKAIVGATVRRLRSMTSTAASVAADSDRGQSTTSTVQGRKQKALSSGNDDDCPDYQKNDTMIDDSGRVVDDDDLLGHEDTQYIHTMLRRHLPSYKRAVSYQRGQMRLLVFRYSNENKDNNNNNRNGDSNNSPSTKSLAANKTNIETFDVLSVKAQNTGRAGLANKGGIVAEVDINNGTRVSFLSAHLEAHEGLSQYNTRVSTIGDIFRGTQSSVVSAFGCDVSLSSHYSFVMGDLNFRTRLPVHEPGSEEHIKAVHQFTRDKYWEMLNDCDELTMALNSKDCLVGYVTPKCNFPPTFKLLRQRGYSYNEKRSPSYTDRILHKGNHLLSRHIEVLSYGPIGNFTSSDHKPIRGAYNVHLNKPLKWRPVLVHNDNSVRWNPGRPGRIIRGLKSMDSTSGHVGSDNLHIFCSSIQCEITREKYGDESTDTSPSPFVSFVSTPKAAMKIVKTKKKWPQYVRFWKPKKKSSTNAADGTKLHHNGCPRSQTILNEKNARWEEEVHFEIRTHDDTGKPLNLTGAVLHILVHDEKDDSRLIGSCTVNLAHLIEMSKSDKEDDQKKVQSSRSSEARTSSSRNIAVIFATRLMNKLERSNGSRNSSCSADASSILRRSESLGEKKGRMLAPVKEDHRISETVDENEHGDPAVSPKERRIERDREFDSNNTPVDLTRSQKEVLSSAYMQSRPAGALGSAFDSRRQESGARIEDIHSIDIDADLTKNGKEVGRVKLTITTWWLSEKVSHGEGLVHRRHSDAPRRRKTFKSPLTKIF